MNGSLQWFHSASSPRRMRPVNNHHTSVKKPQRCFLHHCASCDESCPAFYEEKQNRDMWDETLNKRWIKPLLRRYG